MLKRIQINNPLDSEEGYEMKKELEVADRNQSTVFLLSSSLLVRHRYIYKYNMVLSKYIDR